MCQLCISQGLQQTGGFGCTDAPVSDAVSYSSSVEGPDSNYAALSDAIAYSPAPAATSVSQGATGNPYIDGLLIGSKWNGSFTYSFPQLASDYPAGYTGELSTFGAVTFQQREATRAIMSGQTFSTTTNVMKLTSVNSFIAPSVTEAGGLGNGLNGNGDIRLGESNSAAPTAYAYYPNNNANGNGGDVWFSTNYAGTSNDYRNPYLGGYAYHTHIHELGHAMGLKHSQELGGVANVAIPADRDAIEFTVMSYRSYVGGPASGGYTYGQFDAPQTYMQFDILALQTLYGAYYGTNSGNTVYTWSPTTGETFVNGVSQGTPGGNKVFLTIWDGGGNDTYDFSNYTSNLHIDLSPGGWINLGNSQIANLGAGHTANGNIYNAFMFNGNTASLIENANGGSGNDTIIGNQAANLLHGNGGNDFITGTGNLDIAHGDAGNDQLFFVGNQNQVFGDDGNDWVGVTGNNNALTGGAGDDPWIGASGSGNTLDGQDGNDALFAYGTSNSLFGNAGNDWLGVSGNSNALYAGTGSDWAGATGNGNYLIGGDGGDTLLGLGSNDFLYGDAGGDWVGCGGNNNTLYGGAGADYLAASGAYNILDGGADNDILFAAANAHDHDTFAFLPNYGLDQVFNFVGAVGDKIDIRGWGIVNYAALTPYLQDTPAGLVIAFNGANQLTLNGVHAIDPSWVIYT